MLVLDTSESMDHKQQHHQPNKSSKIIVVGVNGTNTSSTTAAMMLRGGTRRKRSKGTIAGFASGKDNNNNVDPSFERNDSGSIRKVANNANNNPMTGLPSSSSTTSSLKLSQQSNNIGKSDSTNVGSSQIVPSSNVQSSLPPPLSLLVPKQSTYARIVLVCVQNVVRLGARTQLSLCPPGQCRREIRTALLQRSRAHHQNNINSNIRAAAIHSTTISSTTAIGISNDVYFSLDNLVGSDMLDEYDEQEEDYLLNANATEADIDEEGSSGDEDTLCNLDELLSIRPPRDSDEIDDYEKYLQLRESLYEPFSPDHINNTGGHGVGAGGNSSNGPKLPFNRRKMRLFDAITWEDVSTVRSYLRKEEKRAKRRSTLLLKRHLRRVQAEERRRRRLEQQADSISGGIVPVDDFNPDRLYPDDAALLDDGLSTIEQCMTPALAMSLLLESLLLNTRESMEGMAKCYDGIVAAGIAVLDSMTIDPTLPPSAEDKNRPRRSEIMAALAPLLITTLEQPSGDALLMLAKVRRMCGTERYRRRFVQRIAPSLIRPPGGAMWCVRHQNDMEAILAAAELIFDSAFDVFGKGWYERGQLMLADSKRAETLSTAAKQLRNLSSEPSDGLTLGLVGHATRRRMTGIEGTTSDPLAEWEVIAVDKQIRVSISHILTTDWTRATTSEIPKPPSRRSVSAGRHLSIQHSVETSPRSMLLHSPNKPGHQKYPQSPPHMPQLGSSSLPTAGLLDASSSLLNERPDSPPTLHTHGRLPPSAGTTKTTYDHNAGKSPVSGYSASAPPKSPKSPTMHSDTLRDQVAQITSSLSPKHRKEYPSATPLSPSVSSMGASTSTDGKSSFKPSTTTSSTGSASHYRMLTSTAAERKRTVAACRALRAQIQRFEDAFIQLHGRPPKGAADRAPLATTYAQYREWKRAIRADAACRIQAMFRGARTRWALLRSNNSTITRIIMTRAGRSGYTANNSGIGQLSIPSDLGQVEDGLASSLGSSAGGVGNKVTPNDQWSRRWASSGERNNSDTAPTGGSIPKPFSSGASTTSVATDGSNMSFSDLQAKKRELKQQLKQYDMNFARKHGRMPVKAEKEPIRHLYEAYNSLKHQIGYIEDEGRSTSVSSTSLSTSFSQRSSSPASLADISTTGSESESVGNKSNSSLLARNKRKLPKAVVPPVLPSGSSSSVGNTIPNSNGSSTTSGTTVASGSDLTALKAEKSTLHQMLRAYEKDFFKEHRRQVSSFADIRPVASQYRRYKDIKKAIASIQQQGG